MGHRPCCRNRPPASLQKSKKLTLILPRTGLQGNKTADEGDDGLEDASVVDDEEPESEESDDDATSGKKTKVEWVEEIVPSDGSPGRFYLRVGLGRKASG